MYPTPLKAAIRKLTDNIVIASTPFTRARIMNFGARMTLFHYDEQVVVWSAIPYGEEVIKSLKLLTGKTSDFNITYLIIPDAEHTMAAKSFKEKYPEMKIIGMEKLGLPFKIDYEITSKDGLKLLDATALEKIGIKDKIILDNFEMVYLPTHTNKELVLYDKNSKILFEADLILSLGPKGTKLEQYSKETGYLDGYNSHGGLSYITRITHPGNNFFKNTTNKLIQSNLPEVKDALKIIYKWDFKQLVPCHGNVVEEGKPFFKKFFDFV